MKKMIILAVMMVITTAMPAMAGNKKHTNHDKKTTVVVVTNDKKVSHFDRSATKGDACQSKNVDKRTSHFDAHKHAYRPDVKACTFKVSRHDSHRKHAIPLYYPKSPGLHLQVGALISVLKF